ncbi:MAG: copper resistance protein CopC [Armatimonadota bacterium]|nr:copper resistance protein CopC [Armatimonadota bacterium]
MRRLLLAWLVFAALAVATPAEAQVRCLSSFPAPGTRLEAPPGSVILWMNEPVDLQLSQFRVLDPRGRRFDLPARISADGLRVEVPLYPLPDGVYVVHYRAASVLNGHVSVGLYSFGVRTAVEVEERSFAGVAALRAVGAAATLAALASGSVLGAVLATLTAFLEWAQASLSTVPAPWPILLHGGWVGLLLAGTQPGWALLLATATTAAWAVPVRPPRTLLRLVAAAWILLVTPVVAAAGGPLSLLASSHGPALVLMVAAYGTAGVLAALALPVLGVRVQEPSWTRLLLALLLAAAWALRPARDVGEFFALWTALGALCAGAYLLGQGRLRWGIQR